MARMSSLYVWPFLPAVVFFNLAYFTSGFPFWSIILTFSGAASLVYSYFRTITVSPKDRAVLITGCDSGFGHALAERLHTVGYTVFACFLDDQSYGSLGLQSLGSETGRLHVLKMDVTHQEQVDAARRYVENHLPDEGLWGIVNNAGLYNVGFLEWIPLEVYEKLASVNLFGTIRVTKAFLPLIRRSQGRIVNISSITGILSTPFLGAYSITKSGLETFSNILRLEMKPFNVKVCTIRPGNFLAAANITGIAGEEPARTARHFWDQLGDGVQKDYGKQILEKEIATLQILTKIAKKDIEPVVMDMTDALSKLYPKTNYLEASMADKTVTFLNNFLPAFLSDRLILGYQGQLLRIYG